MTSIYPKVPGYIINHDPTKNSFKKTSSLMQEKILFGEINQKKEITHSLPRQKPSEPVKIKQGNSFSQDTFINHFGTNIIEHFEPDYVKLDKQVLRFYCYFKESVIETKLEYARIRLLILYYYLVDDTISIIDVRQVNSGIPQGPFLRKGKIKKNEQSFFTYKDLIVGNDLFIYGKLITLYDCDQYTREFYNGIGITQPEKQDVPKDSFSELGKKKIVAVKDNLMKDYLEHSKGGGRVPSQKQFLENDRKVLKFNAKFEALKYIIHYYLSDDTVEIREVHYPNSGRDPFPLLLKRNKLPRKFSIAQPGEVGYFDFYKDSDIEPFMTLWAFNRPFKILGCDDYTADYYYKKYGRNFPIGGFEDPPPKEKSGIIIPPYNGFGDEADSLGNCLRLTNQPPKKDYFKYIDNDKIILRFKARLNTKIPEDVDRRFLISFFLADDSIQVFEMQCRNSGIWEGKFLERGKYKNAENDNKNFTISDFETGKSMRINTFSFNILEADDFTKKWISDNLK